MNLLSMMMMIAIPIAATPPQAARQASTQIEQAYADVRRRQAALPHAADLREQLIRLRQLDQAGRERRMQLGAEKLAAPARDAASTAAWKVIDRHDVANQQTLKRLIPAEGWFRERDVGHEAAVGAFLIAQHAVNDPAFMRSVAAKLAEFVAEGDKQGPGLALMTDRIALEFDHRPQTYGSQVQCVDGKWEPTNLADPVHVDERRRSAGLPPLSEYMRNFDDGDCPKPSSSK